MYLRRIELTDFQGFEQLEWRLATEDAAAGWHVLLGPNGAGKSTFLKAAAIAFTGATEFMAARRPVRDFIRRGAPAGAAIQLCVSQSEGWDRWAGKGNTGTDDIKVKLTLQPDGLIKAEGARSGRTLWGGGDGWFSAAFGPMRRFAGGNPENLRLFKEYPRLARHLSIFGEDVALTEALGWLQSLRFKQLESSREEASESAVPDLLEQVRRFVNQADVLPHGVVLRHISSEAVEFLDGNGVVVPALALSDGFRAVLSMVFELLRLAVQSYPRRTLFSEDGLSVMAPGVVLIDEVDAHLHPSWQRKIGPCLTRLFPKIQFIVTTHSPYIVQSATIGSVWTLPAPGSGEGVQRVLGEQLDRVLYGDVLHVLNSEAFDGLPGRSPEAQAKLAQWARLQRLHRLGRLSADEVVDLAELDRLLRPLQSEMSP